MRRSRTQIVSRSVEVLILCIVLQLQSSFVLGDPAPIPQFNVPEKFREIWAVDAAAEAKLLASLGDDYQIRHTNHFSIVHSHVSLTADYRGAIAESVYTSFVSFFSERGFELARPESLGIVVLLPTREAFVEHVDIDGLSDETDGIYLRQSNHAYFFDALGRPEVREADKANRKIGANLQMMRRKIARAREDSEWTLKEEGRPPHRYSQPEALRAADRMLRKHQIGTRKLRNRMGQQSIEVMCHEIVHQLAQSTKVFAPDRKNPRWITEGLATFFEPSEHGYLLAQGAIHWTRWDMLQKSHQRGQRITLEDLLTRDALLLDMAEATSAYNESWSLVHYLATTRETQFIEYLRALKTRSEPDSGVSRIKIFENAFGEKLPRVEAGWRDHVARLGEPNALP